jgi:hypothetical protein
MASEKQEIANVLNAQLSTGPTSPEGKAIVSKNALKHGIFARDLVINAGDGREDAQEYHELFTELKSDLAPVGRMEMMLVEKIAVNYWRLRRLVRYETGEIRCRLDDYRESALRSHYSGFNYSGQRPELYYYSYDDEITDAEYQAQCYKVTDMQSTHFNLSEEKAALEYVLWARMDRKEAEFAEKDYKAAKKYVAGLSPQMQGKLRKEMLEEARQELADMEEVRTWQVKFDRIQKAKSLPAETDLNNVIKYENSLERSIFRNLAALKTLQENRARCGGGDDDLLDLPAGAM